MHQVLIAVSDHGTTPVPAPPADDVYRMHRERIGRAHHRSDIGVVLEVFDGDMEPVPPAIDVGDDGFASPITIGVDHIAGIPVTQKLRVILRIFR
ncbi:Uncharacterised protein [Mycobacteroides abscessus subsp. abscessus]|nr:Uncharacterised protein [Mycobacteroides abscessus subsp. abscessus]